MTTTYEMIQNGDGEPVLKETTTDTKVRTYKKQKLLKQRDAIDLLLTQFPKE